MYFQTPTHKIICIFKGGSSSIARAIIAAFYPEIESVITTPHGNGNGTAYPAGQGPDDKRWQGRVPKAKSDTDLPRLATIRDPVERFRSAMAQFNLSDVDAVLDSLQSGTKIQMARREASIQRNPHFTTQTSQLEGENTCYRFPDHLEQFAEAAGLPYPLPTINEATNPKPTLTIEQEAAVRAYYADDVALYDAITEPGYVHTQPRDPAEVARELQEAKQQALAILEGDYHVAEEQGVLVDAADLASLAREVRMRFSDDARGNYQEAANLLQLAGDRMPAAVLWDAGGTELQLTPADAQELLARYAVAVAHAKVTYMQQQAVISNAATIDDLPV